MAQDLKALWDPGAGIHGPGPEGLLDPGTGIYNLDLKKAL